MIGDDPTGPAEADPANAATVRDGDPAPARDPIAPASKIGRYQVLRRLGAGGMGVVYAAHDPELGRTVAIKLVRAPLGGGGGLQERLRREAQALARLHHPNVVSVHDVGVSDEQLYIVMQYVDGVPLDAWIAEHAPSRARIIDLFVHAGRGLAAAHAAGLVHRDFKPGNVLVERDGTVRVTDFGLARLSHIADVPIGDSGGELAESMTRDDVVGTPAYMAPEQFLGGAITAAVDQFGFCVALWEALVGKRPFAGKSFDAIRRAVVTGTIEPMPPRAMSRRVQRAVRRGLSVRAADRFPDMLSLLDQLTPPRRVWLAAAASVAMIGGGALAATLYAAPAAPPCRGVDGALAEVWPARRDAVHAAVAGFGIPDAAVLADAVVAKLDDRADRWRTMRLDACEASKVRHAEDDETQARRTRCLDRSLADLRAATDLLTGPVTALERLNAVRIARTGIDPDDCSADGTLARPHATTAPADLGQRMAELQAHTEVGDDRYVIASARQLAKDAEAAGDIEDAAYAWFQLAITGSLQANRDASDAARQAATLAAQVGDDDLSAQAWSVAAQRRSDDGDREGVDAYLAMADAEVKRSPRAMTAILVEIARGFVEKQRLHLDQAMALCKHAYQSGKATYGAVSVPVDAALGCMFNVAYQRNHFTESIGYGFERAAIDFKLDGPTAGIYYDSMVGAEVSALWLGDPTARIRIGVLADRMSALYGADSLGLLDLYYEESVAESQDGALGTPEALAASAKAVAIATKNLPADDLKRGRILEMRADIVDSSGDHAGALSIYDEALAIYTNAHNDGYWAPVAYNTADGYRNAGKCDRAMPLLARLIQLDADGKLEGSTTGITALGAMGTCLTQQASTYEQGIADQLAAVARLDKIEGSEDFAAQFRDEAADSYAAHGDRAHARELAEQVLRMLPDDGGDVHVALRDEAKKVLGKK